METSTGLLLAGLCLNFVAFSTILFPKLGSKDWFWIFSSYFVCFYLCLISLHQRNIYFASLFENLRVWSFHNAGWLAFAGNMLLLISVMGPHFSVPFVHIFVFCLWHFSFIISNWWFILYLGFLTYTGLFHFLPRPLLLAWLNWDLDMDK